MDSSNPSLPQKYSTLTNEQRLHVARLVSDGKCSISSVSREFSVSWDAVARATKRKSILEEGIEQGTINSNF